MSFVRKNAGKLVASVLITCSMIYMLQHEDVNLWPKASAYEHVRWWSVGAYFLTLPLLSYPRAVRWRFLLRSMTHIPTPRILRVSLIGFAAILLLPFRLGEFVRPLMIREKGKISMTAATGTIVAERVVDGLVLSIILAFALLYVPTIQPLPEKVIGLPALVSVTRVRYFGYLMLLVFASAFVVIGVFYFVRDWAHRTTMAVFGVVSKGLAERLAGTAEKLADGLHAFGRVRDAFGFLFETGLYWLINVLGMWLLAWGCGIVHADGSAVTFGEACALMGMLGVTILIPGPPGLLGVFQAGIYAGMTMYFPAHVVTSQGAAYVFLIYAAQLIWTLGSGATCLFSSKNALDALKRAETLEEPAT